MFNKLLIAVLACSAYFNASADTQVTRGEIGPCIAQIKAANGRTADYAVSNIKSFESLPPSPTRDNAIADMRRQSDAIRNEDPYAFQQPLPEDKEVLRAFLSKGDPPEPMRCLMESRLRLIQVSERAQASAKAERERPGEKRSDFAPPPSTTCGAQTPVSNDTCLSLLREATQQCKGRVRAENVQVLFQSCQQYDGAGKCVNANFACRAQRYDNDKNKYQQINVNGGGGVRG